MNAHLHSTNAGNVGARLGRAWRKLVRREKQFASWVVKKGVPVRAATALVWAIKLVLVAAVLCFSLTVGLLVAVLLIVIRLLSQAEPPVWESDEPTDHKKSLFYHPLSYNDDPDPRFSDPRFEDK